MKRVLFLLISLVIILFLDSAASYAGWLIYHKPEFKGKVIDAGTKEPIEGVVVVAIYKKHTLISGPGGGGTSIVKIRETLTDDKGEFHIPSYTTIIQPNSIEDRVECIIYKPGYGSYPGLQINPPMPADPEDFFSGESGRPGTVRIDNKTFKYLTGIIELPKVTTREERLRAMPATPTDYRSKELPLLFKAINEENKRLGLGEEK